MEKFIQVKQIIDSMSEEDQLIVLSELIETIWGKDRNNTNSSETISNAASNNRSKLMDNIFLFDAEILDFQEYKTRKQAGL
jgi:hypothetical protein